MEKWCLRFRWDSKIKWVVLLFCLYLCACRARTSDNADGYPILLTNNILKQNILEFYYANMDKGEDSSSKVLLHLSVRFFNDTIVYSLSKCNGVNEVLNRNIINYTQLENLTILISLPQLGYAIDSTNSSIVHQSNLTLSKNFVMKALKKDFPQMYKIYRQAKANNTSDQYIETKEMTVLDDRWQQLKFVNGALVYQMVDYGKQ